MESTTVDRYRLKVCIGNNRFFGEGPREEVREDYAHFLERVSGGDSGKSRQDAGNGKGAGESRSDEVEGDGVEAAWDRVYLRKDNSLSLKVLPSSKNANADAIVMLLYGYQTLLNQDSVKTTDLMDAAKQSGLRIDRIERRLPQSHKCYFIRGGTGKGTRYSLNNRGSAYAQNLLEGFFE